jgi:hypothetical protein
MNTKNLQNIIALAFLILSLNNTLCAQNSSYTFSSDIMVSGNGHGKYLGAAVGYKKGLNVFEVIPSIQLEGKKLNAVQFRASHVLSAENDHDFNLKYTRFKAWLFAGVEYYHAAPLSRATLSYELSVANDVYAGTASPRFNTIQFNAGLGANFRIVNALSLKTFISVGYYNHMNMKMSMYHEKGAPILSIGAGMNIAGKSTSKKRPVNNQVQTVKK